MAALTDLPPVSRAIDRRHRWERRFRALLFTSDLAVVMAVSVVAATLSVIWSSASAQPTPVSHAALVAAGSVALWMLLLSSFVSRDPSVIGSGGTEYWRVIQATGLTFGVLAIAAVIFQWNGIRFHLLVALPLGMFSVMGVRWLWRQWLHRRRASGFYTARALVVGHLDDVDYVVRTLGRGELGYQVVGAALDDDDRAVMRVNSAIYPVLQGMSVAEAAGTLNADTIIVASQPSGDPDYIKRLSWELERTAAELVLSSRIADVAGPRMSLRPVEGLPLLHVKIPTFQGGAHLAKRALDIFMSLGALIAFAPVGALIALAIKLDSPGPVFFPQARVGRDGREFRMFKFRSMTVDAEQQRDALLAANEGAGPLFKLHDDPRVTRVGRILRKYSLDEVPQFLNVLTGDMSVVGPRPPLPSEVAAYDDNVCRRLYIKPGITGPWQVGGRSDLTWDESVRLDLRYVENWSVVSDLVIMWRTVKVMVRPEGAY